MSLATDFLLDIATGKNGYSIGKPWRFSQFSLAAIVPIVRATEAERVYRVAFEVGDALKIRDTGSINKVEIANCGDCPVLLKAGEMVVGATQTRMLANSQVLLPGEKVIADCVCVYSSMGILKEQLVKAFCYGPLSVRRRVYQGYRRVPGLHGAASDATFAYTPSLQHQVWGEVEDHSRSLRDANTNYVAMAASGRLGASARDRVRVGTTTWETRPEDLAGRVLESEEKFKEVIKQIPKVENQVGICLLTLNGLDSLESFEHPASWEALRENILRSEVAKVSDVSDQDGVFEFKAAKAKSAIRRLLTIGFEESVTVDKPHTSTILLKSDKAGLRGEVVTLYGQPIHCSFIKEQ